MKPDLTIVPYVSVHPDRINIYSRAEWSPYKPKKPKFEHLVKSDSKHHGKVSVHARRKISKAIEYLLYMAAPKNLPDTKHGRHYNFKVAFVTLTLPSKQMHSDNEIKEKCLNQLIVEFRQRYKVVNYIWRAERQKNGNLHFHLLVDKFIPWSELRDRWNRIINKLGYVDAYRNEMRRFHSGGFKVRADLLKQWEYKKQIKAYQSGKANDWNSPNSTDIHSLYRINKVKEYLCKYVTKDEKEAEIIGRMWGCNFELSNIPGASDVLDSFFNSELSQLKTILKDKVYQGEYFTVINLSVNQLLEFKCENLYRLFCCFMFDHFNYSCQSSIVL